MMSLSLWVNNDIMLHIKRQNVMQAVEDLRNGKPIVMVDDYDREFEGDIVLAAEKATAENLLFAMRHARGLMCLILHTGKTRPVWHSYDAFEWM